MPVTATAKAKRLEPKVDAQGGAATGTASRWSVIPGRVGPGTRRGRRHRKDNRRGCRGDGLVDDLRRRGSRACRGGGGGGGGGRRSRWGHRGRVRRRHRGRHGRRNGSAGGWGDRRDAAGFGGLGLAVRAWRATLRSHDFRCCNGCDHASHAQEHARPHRLDLASQAQASNRKVAGHRPRWSFGARARSRPRSAHGLGEAASTPRCSPSAWRP